MAESIAKSAGVAGLSLTGAGLGMATGAVQMENVDTQSADGSLDQTGNAASTATEVDDFEEINQSELTTNDIEEVMMHKSDAPETNDGIDLEEIFRKEQRIRPIDTDDKKALSIDAKKIEHTEMDDTDEVEMEVEGEANYSAGILGEAPIVSGEFVDDIEPVSNEKTILEFGEVYAIEGNGDLAAEVIYSDGKHVVYVDDDKDGIFDTELNPDDPYIIRDIASYNIFIDDAHANSNVSTDYIEPTETNYDDPSLASDIIDPSVL